MRGPRHSSASDGHLRAGFIRRFRSEVWSLESGRKRGQELQDFSVPGTQEKIYCLKADGDSPADTNEEDTMQCAVCTDNGLNDESVVNVRRACSPFCTYVGT